MLVVAQAVDDRDGGVLRQFLHDAVPEHPRQDISTMSRVNFVMKDGVVFKR